MSVHTRVILHLPRFFFTQKSFRCKDLSYNFFLSCDVFALNHDRLVCEGRTIALFFASFLFLQNLVKFKFMEHNKHIYSKEQKLVHVCVTTNHKVLKSVVFSLDIDLFT